MCKKILNTVQLENFEERNIRFLNISALTFLCLRHYISERFNTRIFFSLVTILLCLKFYKIQVSNNILLYMPVALIIRQSCACIFNYNWLVKISYLSNVIQTLHNFVDLFIILIVCSFIDNL